jgi:hypothetical protein
MQNTRLLSVAIFPKRNYTAEQVMIWHEMVRILKENDNHLLSIRMIEKTKSTSMSVKCHWSQKS